MSNRAMSQARRAQTAMELDRLGGEITRWLAHRRAADPRGQYTTQLAALESFLQAAVEQLAGAVQQLPGDGDVGEAYDQCRTFDLRTVWLRRAWDFFREKFDQRDDPVVGPLLQAADDVVWSCYRQVFVQAEARGLELRPGPAPLPYIDSFYSPEAFPAENVPPDLKSSVDVMFLREHLNRLPVPVVRLPPASVRSPWWLVYLAHEVGHQIQYSMMANVALVGKFREKIGQVISDQVQDDPDAAERWMSWSREIFADVFSILMAGQWAVWAMVDLELRRAPEMFKRRAQYPAPAVRLLLMGEVASRLGLPAKDGLRGAVPAADEWPDEPTRADAAAVGVVATASLDNLPGFDVPLRDLCSFDSSDFGQDGAVAKWVADLLGVDPRTPDRRLKTARLVAGASLAAWADIIMDGNANLPDRRTSLAERSLAAICANAEEGTRAAVEAGDDYSDLGAELGARLLDAPRSELESV